MSETKQKINKLKSEITYKEQEIKRLEQQLEREKLLNPKVKEIATLLHDMLCRWNHTDGCSWEYENDGDFVNERSETRGRYYRRAMKIVESRDADTVIDVLTFIQANR